jgi:hypothetical protein
MLAVPVLPVPPLVEVTLPVTLVFGPEVLPVTVTLKVHIPLDAIVAPVRVIVLGLVVVSKPPQVIVGPDVTTVKPAGSVSVNPTPVSATVEFGLVIVNVRVEVLPGIMIVGLNAFAIAGGATTVIVAVLLAPPVPPFVALTVPVVLSFTPAVDPVTVTLMVHVPLGAIVPPLKLIELGAVVVSVPPHGDELPFATVKPTGNVSVNATPFKVVVGFGFAIVNVSTLVPPSGIVAASNPFEIEGGPITVNVAVLLVAPGPLSFELIAPVVFGQTPVAEPVTVTLNDSPEPPDCLHVAPAASVTPVSVMVLPPLVVTVPPPQAAKLPLATVRPAGRISVKLIPVRVNDAFGLVIVNDRLVVVPSNTLEAPNAFVIVGAAATVNVAVLLVVPVPPLVELTAPVVLFFTPAVAPVTVTLNVHVPLAGTVAPLSVITPVAFTVVSVPPH